MKVDFSTSLPVNNLWEQLQKSFGSEKANKAIQQAIDLKKMQGHQKSLPVLLINTGGVALTSIQFFKSQTGISLYGNGEIILFCSKKKAFQIMKQVSDTQV